MTAFSPWSLTKLREHLIQRCAVVAVSTETLRQILRAGGVSWQATLTWKASSDPDFITKMPRVLEPGTPLPYELLEEAVDIASSTECGLSGAVYATGARTRVEGPSTHVRSRSAHGCDY